MKASIITTGARPRLRIQLESRQILSKQAEETARRKLKVYENGNVRIPYGDYRSGKVNYWMCFWYRNGKRVRESRSSFALLKVRMEEIAIDIQNGRTAMTQFTEDQRASYRRCLEIASKVNAPLELLVSEAVQARLDAVARAKFVNKTCPEIVSEFLEQKDRELKRKKWYRMLKKMLERLAEFYTGPMHNLRAHDLNAWLRSLKGGLIYRRHHRGAAAQLVRYAQGANYLPRDWNELKLVDNPEPEPVKIRTWSNEQVVKLLARTHPNMIPFTALQAFAGVRHEEMNPGEFDLAKRPLDWSDFDWERKLIHITEDTGKTGQDRIVPMEDNLVAWLKPYAKECGRVCDVSNTSNCLSRAKIRAGLPHGRNEARNVLRKTWISARLAIVKNIGQVAEEAGNSVAKIKSNYRRPMTEAQGKRLFGIFPTHADILQIPLGLK